MFLLKSIKTYQSMMMIDVEITGALVGYNITAY